ncbi:Lysine methyltransferase [Desulfonatronum thiosulfatophilum]|uniref:Lysine methyltransferase n=1 Tax=Desulfonatronum thiosulfatophilum TaxID=617002 RepID=A0A1G6AAK4_9BACT|nr:methyltransferase [Desulfonatronum thiosulfatophilum]SDB05422.1 Lysine methyltransferase [Desulfonatronum thiosulfatophilum]
MQLLNRSLSSQQLEHLLREGTLEELMAVVSARNKVHFEKVRVGEDVVECLQVTDMEGYIEEQLERTAGGGFDALPLWAKIWPASLPLAIYMQRLIPGPDERVLEVGAGLGLAGLFAAKQGFSVVVSDIVPEALLFARINALQNNLGESIQVLPIDFVKNGHIGRYHRIIGSEVLYREQFFEPLLAFLRNHLEPTSRSEVLLTADASRRSSKFFAAAKNYFQISRSSMPYKNDRVHEFGFGGDVAEKELWFYRMRPL